MKHVLVLPVLVLQTVIGRAGYICIGVQHRDDTVKGIFVCNFKASELIKDWR